MQRARNNGRINENAHNENIRVTRVAEISTQFS